MDTLHHRRAADGAVARVLAAENGELVIGRFAHRGEEIVVEHTILAGTTMDPVEVQSSVWTVGWAASAHAARLRALLTDAVPVPPAPETPAARLRDAADHVEMTTHRVQALPGGSAMAASNTIPTGASTAHSGARACSSTSSRCWTTPPPCGHRRRCSPTSTSPTASPSEWPRSPPEKPFGAFAHLGGRRELWFQHAILGDDLDEVELDAAIDTVAEVADGWDDRLAEEFGGLRYADLG